jgi:hypothetical protein
MVPRRKDKGTKECTKKEDIKDKYSCDTAKQNKHLVGFA